jgi:hypothetical protein
MTKQPSGRARGVKAHGAQRSRAAPASLLNRGSNVGQTCLDRRSCRSRASRALRRTPGGSRSWAIPPHAPDGLVDRLKRRVIERGLQHAQPRRIKQRRAAVGYGQTLEAQSDALSAAGCQRVFHEKVSGAVTDRCQLRSLLRQLKPGDTLVVTRLDRPARSTRDLLNIVHEIAVKGAQFRSLGDAWADTATAHGRLLVTFIGLYCGV